MRPIEKMTIEELKALGYDQMNELARVQNNLQVINARIQLLEKQANVKDTSPKNK